MKKFAMSIVAVIAAITIVFGMTACFASPEQKLKNYIESEDFQEQLDSMKTSFGSMIDVDVESDENKLVYIFTYKTQIDDENLDAVKEQLETSFNSLSSTYEGIANSMKKDVGISDPVVVIKYNNADGTEIFSTEYNATE